MSQRCIIHIADVALTDNGDRECFVAGIGRAGGALGSPGMGCMLTVVAPGRRASPFSSPPRN
jgi:hypothetical protein